MAFHMRTYADRIEINRFQIGSLTKLYAYSKENIGMSDKMFRDGYEEKSEGKKPGGRTPLQYADRAAGYAKKAINKVGDVAGTVAGDFTGKAMKTGSNNPHTVVLALLRTNSGAQVLARRLYRTFVSPDSDCIAPDDFKKALENPDEAEAAFTMFDKDLNGDISMEELEGVCVEIGRERKSITASLKDLDSVVSKLDHILMFIALVFTLVVFLSLISTSAAGVLLSAGSSILALSWLFSATAQELLQSIIFVFVKHPFDVGDRVTVYGTTGATGTGDDYFVKEISLLYTEFKKMEGHVVQAPNSYLNTLFILNQRRSGSIAEAVPIVIRFGTTLDQIEALRMRLLEFVRSEKREYQSNILTEMREVTENYSITLNIVFFYKTSWQNELLRLQRRNKFICHLMIALQEIGIDGPRLNLPGARPDFAWHSYSWDPYKTQSPQRSPPQYTPTAEGGEQPAAGPSSPGPRHPSILRHRPSNTGSISRAPRKQVDFSLGVSTLPREEFDSITDVHEDRERERVDEVIKVINRREQQKRERNKLEEEEAR
ncbi:hypothetical protein KEM55_006706, partial [Ascosphaera atra]